MSKTCTRHWDFCQSSSPLREKQAGGAQQAEQEGRGLGRERCDARLYSRTFLGTFCRSNSISSWILMVSKCRL